MNPNEPESLANATRSIQSRPESVPIRLTVFTLPKPFTDAATARSQLNALRSWRELGPGVEVLLIGDEEGIATTAAREGVGHLPGVTCNDRGTPLISSAFALANRAARGEYLLYCNADVILRGPLGAWAERLGQQWPAGFLGLGRRRDVKLDRELDWSDRDLVKLQLDELWNAGTFAARVCKEYFLFRRDQLRELPGFAVGRGNWDNWMVANSRRLGWPVVDLSAMLQAFHQEHNYAHLNKPGDKRPSRWECYVAGAEARENERLAGGKWLVQGSSADWRVTPQGDLTRKRLGQWNLDFWLDLPRFLGLSIQLPFHR